MADDNTLTILGSISPDDPRYSAWLVLKGFVSAEGHAANARLLEKLRNHGTPKLSDILDYAQSLFDTSALALIATEGKGVAAAERFAKLADEALEVLISSLGPYLASTETVLGMVEGSLDLEIRVHLAPRVQGWKSVAFTRGVKEDLDRLIAVPSTVSLESAIQIDRVPAALSIGEQLNAIVAASEEISHEEQAFRIGISRSTYFEVKGGRGGREAILKTREYLKRVGSPGSPKMIRTDPD